MKWKKKRNEKWKKNEMKNEKKNSKKKMKWWIEMKTWNKVTRTKIKEEISKGMNKKLI